MDPKQLSHYRIVGKIGAGGMGEVYRAHDAQLDRDVALKLLPDAFADDAERLARFEREARLLASLNHTNIAAIYGIDHHESQPFLVLEYVEGEDLAARLCRGAVPLEDALPIARQIAVALEEAHEQGVIHRDLKPGNVVLRRDGTVKVLDFGLAKALDSGGDAADQDLSHSPTRVTSATLQGVILGTAAYMSPEQARGKPLDKRSDIFAFGCVLFEMLAGRRAFGGETVSDTLAAVLRAEPDWDALPDGTPPALRRLIERCLVKDPKARLRDIGEARVAIDSLVAGDAGAGDAATVAATAPGGVPAVVALMSIIVVATIAAAVAWFAARSGSQEHAAVRKFRIPVEIDARAVRPSPAISPDGSRIAFVESGRIHVRELDRLDTSILAGTDGADAIFWAPNSEEIAYFAHGRLWKTSMGGGSPTIVHSYDGGILGGVGGSWGPSLRIVFSQGSTGILEVSSRGGDAKTLVPADPTIESDLHDPFFLPEERGILFVSHRLRTAPNSIEIFADGKRRVLYAVDDANTGFWYPCYAPAGFIVFRRTGGTDGLWALPFSLDRLEVTGQPFMVVQGGHHPSVSSDGSLLYVDGDPRSLQQAVWVSHDGVAGGTVGEPMDEIYGPVLSPDGRHLAVAGIDRSGDNWDVWMFDIARGARSRFTFAPTREDMPTWTPDGRQVIYRDAAAGTLMIRAADGTGVARPLWKGLYPSVSPDGKNLVYAILDPEREEDIWTRPLSGDGQAQLVYGSPGRDIYPHVSPDGHYLLYLSDESGHSEIYIRPFPSGDGRWQVSTQGGTWPRWSPSGDRVYFLQNETHIVEARVELNPSPVVDTPRILFAVDSLRVKTSGRTAYDVSSDDKRFLMVRLVNPPGAKTDLTFVENWFKEFKDANDER